MRILKATDSIVVKNPVFAIYGQPGIGKSSLGYSAQEPLLLDFDAGAHRAANRRDTLVITNWRDVQELMDSPDVLAPYQTVVVDTVGRCLDLITADIIQTTPKHGRDGSLTLQGYGALKSRFRSWMTQLRTLGKDVVLLAHDKEDGDSDSRIVRPDITGGSYAEVMKIADFLGYLAMSGKNRILDFNPTDRWVGKNPANWNPLPVPPVAKAQDFLGGLIAQGRTALGAISDQSANAAQAVEDWRAQIETFTTPDELTAAVEDINKLPKVSAQQVKHLLKARADALHCTFDTKRKAFVQAQAVAS